MGAAAGLGRRVGLLLPGRCCCCCCCWVGNVRRGQAVQTTAAIRIPRNRQSRLGCVYFLSRLLVLLLLLSLLLSRGGEGCKRLVVRGRGGLLLFLLKRRRRMYRRGRCDEQRGEVGQEQIVEISELLSGCSNCSQFD